MALMPSLFDLLFGNDEKHIPEPPRAPTDVKPAKVEYTEQGLLVRFEDESTGAYIERMLRAKPRPPGLDHFISASLQGDAETVVASEDDPLLDGASAEETVNKTDLSEYQTPPGSKSTNYPMNPKATAAGYTVSQDITDRTLSSIIQIESAGNPKAKAKTSSASGLGQFIRATWLATVKRYRPDWLKGKTTAQVLAMRFDAKKAIEMLARHTEENANFIKRHSIKPTDGALYLAHFAGPRVACNIMGYDPSSPVSKYVSAAAIKANPTILKGKTCGQVAAWAAAKMEKASKGTDWVHYFMKGEGVNV